MVTTKKVKDRVLAAFNFATGQRRAGHWVIDMAPNSALQYAEIAVGGMTCSACTSAVTSALEGVPGVDHVDVSLITERATVKYHDSEINAFCTAIEDAGFEATPVKSHAIQSPPEVMKTEIAIQGMTCGSCTGSVRGSLSEIPGVLNVEVSLVTDTALIEHEDLGDGGLQRLVSAIDDAGFDAQILSSRPAGSHKSNILELKIFGMTSDSNSSLIENQLQQLIGVSDVKVSLATQTAIFTYDSNKTGIRALIRTIEGLGFNAIVAETADNSQQIAALDRVKESQSYYRDTWKTFLLGLPIIVLDKFRNKFPSFMVSKVMRGVWLDDVISVALVLPILLGPARRFYVKSFKALRNGTPTMDVLVTTSVTCAFVYSIFALVHAIVVDMSQHQMYLWDACAMILMFVLLGKYLENRARGRTSRALSELISLVPEEVYVKASDLAEDGETIPTDLLQVGDIVELKPGDKVSADGEVVSGESYISESLLTGESEPILKKIGDRVIGGTINGLGNLQFRVTQCGAETKLSQIISLIKNAQASRAPIQRYVDAAAAKFVPGVLSLSLTTFFGWFLAGLILGKEKLPAVFQSHSLFFVCMRLGISVVVVACPCALGLATPTAVMVGTGAGAEHGILVKGGAVFEMGSKASIVLFDKTGTLTTGRMSVVATTVAATYWPLVRALEHLSEHPVGKTLASYYHPDEGINASASDKPLMVHNFVAIMGEGVKGEVEGHHVFVGRHDNSTVENGDVIVEVDNELVGAITLKDSLRSDAPEVVESLKLQGYTVGVVSGDSRNIVDAVAKEVDIDEKYVWSQMHPENKVEVIETLRAEGMEVVFVGDGINDSPALASASVGMSMEGATHVAVESADVVLRQTSPISGVPAALDLCKTTMRRIKTNLFASVVYNAVMIPFAMGLFLPFHMMLTPIMASGAMALSSVSVVVSSLLLRRWQPKMSSSMGSVGSEGRGNIWARITQQIRALRSKKVQYAPV